MISYSEAIKIIEAKAKSAPVRIVKLQDALGMVAAHDVIAPISLPSFRNSAMDGFAVCANQIAAASTENIITLRVACKIAAGDNSNLSIQNEAVKIMTGAQVPKIYDAVVPVEFVESNDETVVFSAPAKTGDNIREIGEDVFAGNKILSQGEVISAQKIMLLAAMGLTEIAIKTLYPLKIISTGNEIVDVGAGNRLPTQIYNSNSPYLLAEASKHGFEAEYLGIFRDEAKLFSEQILQLCNETNVPKIIISTGAVSKGEWDFIPETLKELGAEIHFHRVNIRPGKPVLFATLPDGSYYFGLPGNPISTVIGFQFFVLPLIEKILGRAQSKFMFAKTSGSFTKKGNFRQFLKANLSCTENAELFAEISSEQESFKIQSLAAGNCWVILDENCMQVSAGEIVKVLTY